MVLLAKRKIILDTDIGSDIDDAVCLAYLLMQPKCELLGITTVSGESDRRAMVASAIVMAAGKDLPIFPGVNVPLLTKVRQPICSQAARLGDWPHRKSFPQQNAIAFMRDAILANPGEVTLLAIGPMTNVALLFATYPEVVPVLGSLVLMCGRFGNGLAGMPLCEWNALNDPYATAMVYNAPATSHRSIGLDVTMQVTMDAQEVAKAFTHPVLLPVYDFAKVWFAHTKTMTFHDPLAAAVLFDESICTWERGNATIETASEQLMGLTHWTKDAKGRHEIATTVQAERFFAHYFSVFA